MDICWKDVFSIQHGKGSSHEIKIWDVWDTLYKLLGQNFFGKFEKDGWNWDDPFKCTPKIWTVAIFNHLIIEISFVSFVSRHFQLYCVRRILSRIFVWNQSKKHHLHSITFESHIFSWNANSPIFLRDVIFGTLISWNYFSLILLKLKPEELNLTAQLSLF